MIDVNRTCESNQPTAGKLAYKPAEAAELLSISERSLWCLQNEGRIRAIKIGRSVRYPLSELERFLATELERGDEID